MRPFLQEILERLSSKLGARVVFADQFGYAGYVEFGNGVRSFFRGTSFDLNPQGASKIAADKDYAAKLLRSFGYLVPDGVLIFSPRYRSEFQRRNASLHEKLNGLETALSFASTAGFPLFVKPNDESEGKGVSRVYEMNQLADDVQMLFFSTDHVLIQKPLIGNDFRVVILDGDVISAYRRIPLRVFGDGKSTLYELIEARLFQLREAGRGKKIESTDSRIQREVFSRHLTFRDVPARGEIVVLLPNANLSTGGEAEDLTDQIDPSFRSYCAKIAHDMGLRICGIDLITSDITIPLTIAPILEINSAPGLNNFATLGAEQHERVERLYERLLMRIQDRKL